MAPSRGPWESSGVEPGQPWASPDIVAFRSRRLKVVSPDSALAPAEPIEEGPRIAARRF